MRRAALFVVSILAATAWISYLLFAPSRTREIFVNLPPGTSARAMGSKLQQAGVIRSRYGFLLLRLAKGGRLQAGEYRFAGTASAASVYMRIQHGDVYTRTVLIPEGYNLFDIAHAVEDAGLGPASAFLAAAHANVDLIYAYAPRATSLEGFLYPDTYRFSRQATIRSMQETMVKRFHAEAGKLALTGNVLPMVTLASLVEKEVRFHDERGEAAAVFTNRLAHGMPLQTDPSVIYAAQIAGRWTGTIRRSDLQFDSPYNTYLRGGLPPGPICSPGAAALLAAMHPAATDNLYFVADTTGHTLFSRTLKEHAAKVMAYRKRLASASTP